MLSTNKKYSVIYADPPWQYNNTSSRAAAENHYPTMNFSELCQLPINNIAESNSVLFMWWVPSMPCAALNLVEAWGFRFKTMTAFTWAKRTKTDTKWFFGMGNYTRSNAENVLLAYRGKIPKVSDRSISQLVVAPVDRHSKKPDEVRDRIDKLYPNGNRIELFARESFENWDHWGNEL